MVATLPHAIDVKSAYASMKEHGYAKIETKNGLAKIVWKPQPRQAYAMSCPAHETFFGGAKGGGKSDFLIGDFAAHARREGDKARGVLFRKSYSELEELQQRAEEVYPLIGAIYLKVKRTWVFPEGGTLKMRFAERDSDARKYQGHNYSWIGIDEVGNYPTPNFLCDMLSCLRSAKGAQGLMRVTGNPGGPGHGWLKRRYVDGLEPNKVHTFMQKIHNPRTKETEEVPLTRAFIPSFIWDNKILIDNDKQYLARLQGLPEHLRKAYLEGSWDIFVGQLFGELEKGKHFINPHLLPWDWTRFATLDWGYVKPFSFGFWTVSPEGVLIRFGEEYGCVKGLENEGVRKSAKAVSIEMAPILASMGISEVFADSAMWQQHGNDLTIAEIFAKGGVPLKPTRKDRKAGMDMLHSMMQETAEDGLPMLRVFNTCKDFWRTMTSLVVDKNNPEDVDSNCEDHIFDECKYAVLTHHVTHPRNTYMSAHRSMRYGDEDRDYAR